MLDKSSGKRIDRSDVLSLLAFVISLGAFFVSLYEANILRQQQQLMVEQQKSTVLPYLVVDVGFQFEEKVWTMKYSVQNKGIGLAKLSFAHFQKEEQYFSTYNELKNYFVELLPDSLSSQINLSYTTLEMILSPEEKLTWLSLTLPRFAGDRQQLSNVRLEHRICYCSIYDDCWQVTDQHFKPIKGCFFESSHSD